MLAWLSGTITSKLALYERSCYFDVLNGELSRPYVHSDSPSLRWHSLIDDRSHYRKALLYDPDFHWQAEALLKHR